MKAVGAEKVAPLVCDNASNMVCARNEAERDPALAHIIFLRCFMHGFSLCMGSILGHPAARSIVSEASRIVTYFRASHAPGAALKAAADQLNIKQGLQRANTTRFTSTFSCLHSVHKLEEPLRNVVSNDERAAEKDKIFPKKIAGVQMCPCLRYS